MDNANNDNIPPDNQPGLQEEIRRYVLSNLLSILWTASLLVGGIIFWLYYFEIEYFPDLEFDESILLMVVTAFAGAFYLIVITLFVMTPYFIRWILLQEYPSSSVLSKNEKVFNNEVTWYFGSTILFSLVALLYCYQVDSNSDSFWLSFSIWVLILIVLFGHTQFYLQCDRIKHVKQHVAKWLSKLFDKKESEESKNKKNCWECIFSWKWKYLLAWIFSSLMILVLFLIFDPVAEKMAPNDALQHYKILGSLILIIMTSNLCFAVYREKTNLWYWFIPFIAVFFLSFSLGTSLFIQIPQLVMNKFKFGHIQAQRLLVDEKGCEILKKLKLKLNFAIDKKTCYLKEIKILSRLGKSFYLETETPSIRFTIPSDQVLSWSINKPDKQNEEGTDKDLKAAQTPADAKRNHLLPRR